MKVVYVLLAALALSFFFIECATGHRPPTRDKEDGKKAESSGTSEDLLGSKKEAFAGDVDYEEKMLKGKTKKKLKEEEPSLEGMLMRPSTGASGDYDEEEAKPMAKKLKKSASESDDSEPSSYSPPREERKRPTESGLKAGYSDDNKQFNYFVRFLEEKSYVRHLPLPISERITLKVTDKNGKSIPNADISILAAQGQLLEAGRTMSDGSFLFFPSGYSPEYRKFLAKVSAGNNKKELFFSREGARQITVAMDTERPKFGSVPLDILFIMDTTGSMGEEINRLKATIELININIANFTPKPEVRFGMVLYRDTNDSYVTFNIPLTADLDEFNRALLKVEAGGGGDGPEDLQTALNDSLNKVPWNTNGVRLAFIITDAPPHLDYGQKYNYALSAMEAKRRAIKYFSIGTGGLDIMGEYVLRQIAQYTSGKYIFLNYGEKGDSEGGAPGSVSHHIGSNYQTDKLEAIVINIAREEIGNLSETVAAPPDEYFKADKIETEKNADTLQKLFNMALSQLEDYSSLAFSTKLPTAVMPIEDKGGGSKIACEYFTEQAAFSLSRSRFFKPLERMDLQKVMTELSLNQTTVASEENAAKVGKLLGAKAIIIGNSFKESGYYHIFLKLVDSETGVILSMTKLVIDEKLGVK